jgi:hypothetical protein
LIGHKGIGYPFFRLNFYIREAEFGMKWRCLDDMIFDYGQTEDGAMPRWPGTQKREISISPFHKNATQNIKKAFAGRHPFAVLLAVSWS